MYKFADLVKGNKLLFISFGLSIAVIILGILLIALSPEDNPASTQVESSELVEPTLMDSLNETESLIISASQSATGKSIAGQDAASVERGSEEWCEYMMLKNGNEWREADTQLFGQKCL